MSEPVLQVKGLKTYYYTEEGVGRLSSKCNTEKDLKRGAPA